MTLMRLVPDCHRLVERASHRTCMFLRSQNSAKIGFTLAILAMVGAGAWFSREAKAPSLPPSWKMAATASEKPEPKRVVPRPSPLRKTSQAKLAHDMPTREQGIVDDSAVTILGAHDFVRAVEPCFRGHPCELADEPWDLYSQFKKAGRTHEADLLISFLRSRLRDPVWRNRYRDVVHQMIQDFYPPSELDFQQAAYHNYLGENETSLDLYLQLERKVQSRPEIRKAPKLNIANVFYDLGRWHEALPYYRAAMKETLADRGSSPDTRAILDFVQSRIDELQDRSRIGRKPAKSQ